MGRVVMGAGMALLLLWGTHPVAAFQVAQDLQPVSLGARCAAPQVDQLLDPENTAVTLEALERAAHAVGKTLRVEFA